MDSNEFWRRAFIAVMGGNYGQEEPGLCHATNARYCERAADAALEVAQRRGMVTAGPTDAGIEFTAQPGCISAWTVTAGPADFIGREVLAGGKYYPLHDGSALRIEWSAEDRPTKALIERPLAVVVTGSADPPRSPTAAFDALQRASLRWLAAAKANDEAEFEAAGEALLKAAEAIESGRAPAERPAPELERVEFTADIDRSNPNLWRIGVHQIGVFRAWPGEPTASLDGNVIRIKWGESCPPKPIDVWLERKGGV